MSQSNQLLNMSPFALPMSRGRASHAMAKFLRLGRRALSRCADSPCDFTEHGFGSLDSTVKIEEERAYASLRERVILLPHSDRPDLQRPMPNIGPNLDMARTPRSGSVATWCMSRKKAIPLLAVPINVLSRLLNWAMDVWTARVLPSRPRFGL